MTTPTQDTSSMQDASPTQNASPVETTAPDLRPTPSRTRVWPLWLFTLLLAAAISGIGVMGYPLLQRDNQHAVQMNAAERSAQEWRAQLRQELAVAHERVAQQEEQLSTLREREDEFQRQIDQLARTQLETQGRSRTDWVLAETEYLLRLANQRLLLERDPLGALTLLDAASARLADIEDAGTLLVRKQLAAEIMALKAIPAADRTAIFLQLEGDIALLARLDVSTLKPAEQKAAEKVVTTPVADEPPPTRWQAIWFKVRDALMSAVTIRRFDTPIEPLPSPELARYAIMGAQLRLEQAQIAALRGNHEVYTDSLTQAQAWLHRYFDNTLPAMVALTTDLKTLGGLQLNPKLPDISASQRLLAERIALTRPQAAPPTTPPTTAPEAL